MRDEDDEQDITCFVVGCARSGTTLLSVLLDRHSRLAVPPETGFYNEIAAHIESCDPTSVERLLAGWSRLAELGLTTSTVMAQCNGDLRPGAVLRAILTLFAKSQGKRFCGEKTPIHRKHIPQILQDFPGARVLYVYRDGRDVALSLIETPWWGRGLAAATELWLDAAREMPTLQAAFPDRLLALRYEDLVLSPQASLTPAMAFIGLEFEPRQLDPQASSGVVLPRSMAWKGRSLAAVDAGRIGRWRAGFSSEDQAFLETRLGAELCALGYG